MTISWKLPTGTRGVADVRGFRHQSTARGHAKDHYLSAGEHWEQVAEGPAPVELAERLRQLPRFGPETDSVLEQATTSYVETVRRHTSQGAIARVSFYLYEDPPGAEPVERMGVVSKAGIFSAFSTGKISDLRTALRPVARTQKRPTRQHYLDGANRKLRNLVARSMVLQKRQSAKS